RRKGVRGWAGDRLGNLSPPLHSSTSPFRLDRNVIWRDHQDGVVLARCEQAARGLNHDRYHHRGVLCYLRDDSYRRAAKFYRERNKLSRIEHLPVREISRKHRCRWRIEEKISESTECHLSAGAALLSVDAGRCSGDLPEMLWSPFKGTSGL